MFGNERLSPSFQLTIGTIVWKRGLSRVLSALVYNGHNLMGGGNTTIISCLIVGNAECSIQEFGEKRNRLKRKNVTKPLRH